MRIFHENVGKAGSQNVFFYFPPEASILLQFHKKKFQWKFFITSKICCLRCSAKIQEKNQVFFIFGWSSSTSGCTHLIALRQNNKILQSKCLKERIEKHRIQFILISCLKNLLHEFSVSNAYSGSKHVNKLQLVYEDY